MKNRPALLFCLFSCLSFFPIELSAQPINTGGAQPVGSRSLFPGDYWGRTRPGKYSLHAIVGTNGAISMVLYDSSAGIFAEGGIQGAGTNLASGLVYVSFGDAGYLKAHVQRSELKLVGRVVFRIGDKVKTRRCMLEWQEPPHGVIIVIQLPEPAGSTPAGVTREEAEAVIELRRQELQEQHSPGSATILPPTRLRNFLAPSPLMPPAP